MKIAIDSSGFSELIGARDFLKSIVKALRIKKGNELYLIVCNKHFLFKTNKKLFFKRYAKEIKKIKNIINSYKKDTPEEIDIKKLNDFVKDILDNNFYGINIITYSTKKELKNLFRKLKIDFILPTVKTYNHIKYISYLFDCQHKYYPQFFTARNLFFRNRYFSKVCRKSPAIIVNSKNAKNDLIKFYHVKSEKIFSLPFAPLIKNKESLSNQKSILKKYSLPKKYFIVSNQFWKHKSLETVFDALKILNDNGKNYFVVFTGTMEDDRFPNYICELKNYIKSLKLEKNIKFLGLIPKREQLEILKNSIAVIQPTLFEGGPGGGSVQDAISLGVRAIVTDIPINHELPIKERYLELFKKKDSKELARKMEEFWKTNYKRPDKKTLLKKKKDYIKKLSDNLYFIIEEVLSKKKS